MSFLVTMQNALNLEYTCVGYFKLFLGVYPGILVKQGRGKNLQERSGWFCIRRMENGRKGKDEK